jgi:hypothetical protein
MSLMGLPHPAFDVPPRQQLHPPTHPAVCILPQDAPNISSNAPTLFVTRSGKPPALHMGPQDFVAITGFDEARWQATYR